MPEAPFVASLRALIIAAVAFHAAMVFLVNAPFSAFRDAFRPILNVYNGPYVNQGWAIFAPTPPSVNPHVLVRGKHADGTISSWYDASRFFTDVVGPNRLNPVRELGEGLGHAALIYAKSRDDASGRALLTRTATIVLKLYDRRPLVAEQIEIDAWNIPTPTSNQNSSVHADQWPWQSIPNVESLQY